jgi:inosine/xanthosine triphosphate pyrophosphatase family protein/2-polyprenyl-3-methyl-5-hydroxy-6-metoxy-1,4-benzoquinol methylase
LKHVYFATSNTSKFDEAKSFLALVAPQIKLDQFSVEIPEVQSDDQETILRQKVAHVQRLTNRPFIIDDASFDTDRYPGFPGNYAKFINKTLGLDGMRKLFDTGDVIRATSMVALSYLGEVDVFNGQLTGHLDFGDTRKPFKELLNSLTYVSEDTRLGDAIRDPKFLNHRRIALTEFADWLTIQNTKEAKQKSEVSIRWTDRSGNWANIIEDSDSYVNFENNYARMNDMIRKFGPKISGKAIEIGCGSGEAGRILKQSNPSLDVLSTDISDGMLDEAKRQTALQGLAINYKKVDITQDDLTERDYDLIFSRGVVISHLPKGDVYDYVESITSLSKQDGYLIFDFIQSVAVGDVEKPVDTKNEFTLEEIDDLLHELGWTRIDSNGTDTMRVMVVCYRKQMKSVKM